MTLQKIDRLMAKFDGWASLLYPLIQDELMEYDDWELPFRETFLCFDYRYLQILKHMKEQFPNQRPVVDIGCQFGFQSYFFDDYEYTGVDSVNHRFFRQGKEHIQYQVGIFPDIDIDLSDKTVISCMSLGYFNAEAKNAEIAEKLAAAELLYMATTYKLASLVGQHFAHCELIDRVDTGDHHMYVFWGKGGQAVMPVVDTVDINRMAAQKIRKENLI